MNRPHPPLSLAAPRSRRAPRAPSSAPAASLRFPLSAVNVNDSPKTHPQGRSRHEIPQRRLAGPGRGHLAPAQEASLKEARERWLRGNYEEARELYQDAAKDAKLRNGAAIGLSRCAQSIGEYDKALEAIDTALKASARNPDLLARRAELLHLRGKWEDAEKAADEAVKLKADCFLARWVLAQLYRDRGDMKKADAACRWFVRTFTDRSDNDKDITDPDELLLVGLAGAENARWNKLSDQFEFILNDVYNDAFKRDKNFWPAKYQAGVLLLEKYNRADAIPAFEKALAVNPKAAEVYVGKGQAALQKYEIKDAEEFAEEALKINPRLIEALNLRADVFWMGGNVTKAMRELVRARSINPRDETTLGRIAACLHLEKKTDEFKKIADEVEKFDSKAGTFYQVLAERLEDRRHYEAAEKYYKKAIELRPMVPWPQNSLGMLYMRMGREEEASPILEKAFDADEFNVRVDNTLKVLRHLKKYQTMKTEHFILRFDPEEDKLLGELMATYLEDIYEKLAEKFKYRPKGPFVIEVFNSHEMFSGRVDRGAGPAHDRGLHGADGGDGVAARQGDSQAVQLGPRPAPRAGPHLQPGADEFPDPALVHGGPRRHQRRLSASAAVESAAAEACAGARRACSTSTPSTWASFGRESSEQWHQAYCQSQLYVEFITDTYGKDKIGGLLAAFADGMDTASAIQKVCKVDKATFEKGYLKHLDKVVGEIRGKPAEKALTFVEARQAHEKDPTNNDVGARLAEFYLKRDKARARKLADEVLARKKGHPLACYVKAQLLTAAGEDEAALKLLEEATSDPKVFEPKATALLAKTYFDAAKFDKAAELLERARKAEPYESKWMAELVRVYAQNGDKEKHVKLLTELAPTDADDIDVRKELAKLLLDLGKHAESEKYAREAMEIDVLDPEAAADARLGAGGPEEIQAGLRGLPDGHHGARAGAARSTRPTRPA